MSQHPYSALLAAGAAVLDDSGLERLRADVSAPVRVAVTGRAGAGRGTVRQALRAAWRGADLVLADPGEDADVSVYVFVETLTPDDVAQLVSPDRPSVAVLNKADLTSFRGEGPLVAAAARCEESQRRTGVPTRPLAALLAVAAASATAGDGSLIDALRTIASDPGRLAPAERHRLLAELDVFGTAIAAAAVGRGADAPALAALLYEASGVSAVLDEIDRAVASIRYRRLNGTLARLADLAIGPRGARVAEFLSGDAVVLARMAAALDVVGAAADRAGGCAPHLRRAIHWRRYAQGPVSDLHRACGTDISRGALRLWLQAGGVAEAMP